MKTKPRPRRTAKPKVVQRTLFDAKPMLTVKPNWKSPPHRKSEDPGWFWTWQPPATEDVALRRRVLGW